MLNPSYIIPYLSRIGLSEPIMPTIDQLKQLHRQHLLHIPFENLDIHRKRPICLDSEHLYQKIVANKRGGFCYELNGLFCALLNALGYHCHKVSAKVYNSTLGRYGAEFDHMALIVSMGEVRYLVDVGFGELMLEPLLLNTGAISKDLRGEFVIEVFDEQYFSLNKIKDSTETPKYLFSLTPRSLDEFLPMCHYHQHNPNSYFVQNELVTLAHLDGRITLMNGCLTISTFDRYDERQLTKDEYPITLAEHFGIVLD